MNVSADECYLENFFDLRNHKFFNLLGYDICSQTTEFRLNKFEAAASGCLIAS